MWSGIAAQNPVAQNKSISTLKVSARILIRVGGFLREAAAKVDSPSDGLHDTSPHDGKQRGIGLVRVESAPVSPDLHTRAYVAQTRILPGSVRRRHTRRDPPSLKVGYRPGPRMSSWTGDVIPAAR